MIVAVVGSRGCNSYDLVEGNLKLFKGITKIVSGDAKGADQLGKTYAKLNNIPYQAFLPDWKKYGLSAGPLRNKTIVDSSDCVIAFWDGVSKGTSGTIEYAKIINKPCLIIKC